MKTLRIAVLAAAMAVPSLALAQDDNRAVGGVGGALGGAAVGTVVGGPVGAVVGAGVGAIIGSNLPQQPSVTYSQPVVAGEVLPQTVTVYPVPQYRQYDYAIVNNHRVIIDPATRRVVRLID
jgi:phage tail tape-measure protein